MRKVGLSTWCRRVAMVAAVVLAFGMIVHFNFAFGDRPPDEPVDAGMVFLRVLKAWWGWWALPVVAYAASLVLEVWE